MDRVLITGGNGYIGSNLSHQLSSMGCCLAFITRNKPKDKTIKWIHSEVDFESSILEFNPNIVIHLAAQYDSFEIDEMISCNLSLPVKILQALSKLDVDNRKFISIGTYWEYGDRRKAFIPINEYAASKKSLKCFLEYFSEYKRINILDLKLYGSYGYNDKRKKIVDLILDSCFKEEPLKLTKGEQRLNLLHVKDICKGIITAAQNFDSLCNGSLTEYSIYSDTEYTIRDIVNYIDTKTIFNTNVLMGSIDYREEEVFEPLYANNKLPGWQEHHSLESFIRDRLNSNG